MKRTLIASLLAAASFYAVAADYYVVVPMPKSASAQPLITVGLSTYTLPDGTVGVAYPGFDFKSVLQVTGDTNYNASNVSWRVAAGALPAGMQLNANGTLSGTPTAATAGQLVSIRADYKTKSGQADYQIIVVAIQVTLAPVTLANGRVNINYSYDFKQLLSSTGDPNFSSNQATFTGSNIPSGLALSAAGVLSGKPTTLQLTGQSMTVTAAYKGVQGSQSYNMVVKQTGLEALKVSTALYHSCAVTGDGGVKCWGGNASGQLGDGSSTTRTAPTWVSGLGAGSGVVSVSVGSGHSCALLSTGAVKCWGVGTSGELGNGSTASSTTPVTVSGAPALSAIAAGASHTCGIAATGGAVYCWGMNTSGQLGDNTATNRSSAVQTSGLTSVSGIAGGAAYTCAVTTAKTLSCWGSNTSQQLGNGTSTSTTAPTLATLLTAGTVQEVSAGLNSTCAVLTDGTVKCWGQNNFGQLGAGNASNYPAGTTVAGITGANHVSMGDYHGCASLTSGAVRCWGWAADGQMGNGNVALSVNPTSSTVTGVTSPQHLDSGSRTTCVVQEGIVRCWGSGVSYQLGNGVSTSVSLAVDAAP